MRQELRALKQGLVGRLKIAAIPTALPMVSALTTPYRAKHPNVTFTDPVADLDRDVLSMLENLEVDAGLTYIDNEPLGRMRAVPLYLEQYRLLTSETARWATATRSPGPRSDASRSAC